MATDVVYDGPAEPFALGELVERERVEVLVDELLGLTPVLDRALERLVASPQVGTVASRFMGRIVGEVLQANKAVADKVPGLGQLMSFGTSAASKVMGAADKQFEGLISDSMGKGGTFAVRRLNRIVIETLNDPTTREAVLQVWDLMAQERVAGLSRFTTREEISEVVDAVHELAVTTVANEHVASSARWSSTRSSTGSAGTPRPSCSTSSTSAVTTSSPTWCGSRRALSKRFGSRATSSESSGPSSSRSTPRPRSLRCCAARSG